MPWSGRFDPGSGLHTLLVLALVAIPAVAPRAQVVVGFEDVHGPCCNDDQVQGPAVVVAGPVTVTSPGPTVALGTTHTGLGSDSLRILASNGGTTLQFATPITDLWLRCFRSSALIGPAVYEVTGMGAPFTFSLPNGIIVPLHWKSPAPTTSVNIRLVTGGLNAVHITIDDLRTLALPPGCVAWWSMEPSTSGLLEDTIGYHDGTFFPGMVLASGGDNHVLKMAQTLGYVLVPEDDAFDFGPAGPGDEGDMSFTAWARMESFSTFYPVSKGQFDVGWFFRVSLFPEPAGGPNFGRFEIGFMAEGNLSGITMFTDATPYFGTWHHFAATIDRELDEGISLYLDGVHLGNFWAGLVEWNPENALPVRIGFNAQPGTVFDEIAVFRRVLTPAEVAALAAVPPPPDSPWTELGYALAGTSGRPCLAGSGELMEGGDVTLHLVRAKPDAMATLVLGLERIDQAFKGGVLVPAPDILMPGLPVDSFGKLTLSSGFPSGVLPGLPIYFQYWIPDPAAPAGFAASTALQGLTD